MGYSSDLRVVDLPVGFGSLRESAPRDSLWRTGD
jgi:hypothetical protein